jgi:aromatic ring-opening dioxygenase catalytic subunit (LigB family)
MTSRRQTWCIRYVPDLATGKVVHSLRHLANRTEARVARWRQPFSKYQFAKAVPTPPRRKKLRLT